MDKRRSSTTARRAKRSASQAGSDERAVSAQPCPVCQSRTGIPIVYGLPGPDLVESAGEGRVHLGGCVIYREAPEWHCRRCGYEWRGTDSLA